jgi:hypothetical protein
MLMLHCSCLLTALVLTDCANHCCNACVSDIHPCKVQAVTNDWQQGLKGARETRIGTAAAAEKGRQHSRAVSPRKSARRALQSRFEEPLAQATRRLV